MKNLNADIRYVLTGCISAEVPKNFSSMTSEVKESWAKCILNDISDNELLKGTHHYTTPINGQVFDETPDVEAIEQQNGEDLIFSTEAWMYVSGRKSEPNPNSPLYEVKEIAIRDDDIHSLIRDMHVLTSSEHINCFGEDPGEDPFEIRISFSPTLNGFIDNYGKQDSEIDISKEFSKEQLLLLASILLEIKLCGHSFATVYKN